MAIGMLVPFFERKNQKNYKSISGRGKTCLEFKVGYTESSEFIEWDKIKVK